MRARRWLVIAPALAVMVAGSGCDRRRQATARLLVRAPIDSGIDLTGLGWRGPVVGVLDRGPHGLLLEVAGSAVAIELSHPAICSQRVTVEGATEVLLEPALVAESKLQIGFDQPFELVVSHRCREDGQFRWRQISGPTIPNPIEREAGRRFLGRTHRLDQLHPTPLSWGIVPLSPANRGEYQFEVTWESPGGDEQLTATVRVTAAARATGVPSVGQGQRLVLGGEGWEIAQKPANAEGELLVAPGRFELTPDQVGQWKLRDGQGRGLLIRVGRYDDTPLDCGRAECHPTATDDARATLMTTVYANGINGRFGPDYDPRCAVGCHTVGEPGVGDGGFDDVARTLEVGPPARGGEGGWDRIPRDLRRLGGVGCTGCHGPAAIPMPGVAKTILRGQVCAVCHDRPPRYGHYASWRSTAMAVADADPRTRDDGCDHCHTTGGFLKQQDAGFLDWQRQLKPIPDEVYFPSGVSCAACHDPHGGPTAQRLVRKVDLAGASPRLAGWTHQSTGVCVPCHSPSKGAAGPATVPLLLGEGGLAVVTGAPLVGPSPHLETPRGCLGCHSGKPATPEVERGGSHNFGVPYRCFDAECHTDQEQLDRYGEERVGLEQRIEAARIEVAAMLGSKLAAKTPVAPPSTGGGGGDPAHAVAPADRATAEQRALYDLDLIAEDPGALHHNPAYVRLLLDEVEAWLALAEAQK